MASQATTARYLTFLLALAVSHLASAARDCEASGFCSLGHSKQWVGDIRTGAALREMLAAVSYKVLYHSTQQTRCMQRQPLQLDWMDGGIAEDCSPIYTRLRSGSMRNDRQPCPACVASCTQQLHTHDATNALTERADDDYICGQRAFLPCLRRHVLAQALQLVSEARQMGFAHFLLISNTQAGCDKMLALDPLLSCAWDSTEFNGKDPHVHQRLRFFGRAIRLGYNVLQGHCCSTIATPCTCTCCPLQLDGDTVIFRDPYVYLKRPPLAGINLLTSFESGPDTRNNNIGMVYAQNTRPDGPTAWVFRWLALMHGAVSTAQLGRPVFLTMQIVRKNRNTEATKGAREAEQALLRVMELCNHPDVRMVVPNGSFSSAWHAQLRDDCPDCPWWDDQRPLKGGSDSLVGPAGELLLQTATRGQFVEDHLPKEIIAQGPGWFVQSMTIHRQATLPTHPAARMMVRVSVSEVVQASHTDNELHQQSP
ncbi:uncharacterized protein HaLaN_09269 [Haematococcus lacustris]|uniref:Nucleotide-diphospho-sugar transferase domain-containing protein n=1 Tax=Haematococcus lacustris TaxID=44745 RepID=A0A699YT86_HAELA|nr:uncharacterized protein HaLaN_09269 [Haematococcus lacustris]